jgi:hypothetical protein
MDDMNGAGAAGNAAIRRDQAARIALVAAYCEGLGFVPIGAVAETDSVRIVAGGDLAQPRWWCRRASDAGRVAAAATARLQRLEARRVGDLDGTQRLQLVDDAIAAAAKQLAVALRTHGDVCAEALAAIGRVDEEIAKLQRAGGLKSVNKSYREYRIAASARGERIMRYADWMSKYREKLVRDLAAAMRSI